MLTDAKCRNAKPKERPYRIADRDALFLLVKPNGAKLWQYRYRLAGRENVHSLGPYPRVSLKEAREALAAARKLVGAGVHPGHHRKEQHKEREAERQTKAAVEGDTVSVIVRDWLAWLRWTQPRKDRVHDFLTRHVLPRIGNIPGRNLTPQSVRAALDKVVAEGKVYTARLCKQWLRAALRWAEERGRIDHDPTIKITLPKHRHEHKRPLKPDEIAGLWGALEGYGAEDTRIAIRLLLLTFARPTELRQARWSEIDGATWRIPAERTKMRTPHIVPLSAEAQELIERLRKLNGDTPFLFPGIKRDKPATAQAWHGCLSAIGWLDRFSPHAARATASTLLRELGYSSDWIEVQLAHQHRDEIRASYDFAEYLPQRREMMARWSAYVLGLAKGEVQALPSREAA
jgi:integrase